MELEFEHALESVRDFTASIKHLVMIAEARSELVGADRVGAADALRDAHAALSELHHYATPSDDDDGDDEDDEVTEVPYVGHGTPEALEAITKVIRDIVQVTVSGEDYIDLPEALTRVHAQIGAAYHPNAVACMVTQVVYANRLDMGALRAFLEEGTPAPLERPRHIPHPSWKVR